MTDDQAFEIQVSIEMTMIDERIPAAAARQIVEYALREDHPSERAIARYFEKIRHQMGIRAKKIGKVWYWEKTPEVEFTNTLGE